MSNETAPFPPQNYYVIARAPDMWQPADGEVIHGYPADVRRDVIGILLTAPYPPGKGPTDSVYIETKREEIQGLASLCTPGEHPTEKDPNDPTKPRATVMVNHVAIRWNADLEAYDVAMENAPAVDLQAVLTALVAERTQAMALVNAAAPAPAAPVTLPAPASVAAPVPAAPPTNSSTPTPEVAPVT